MNLTLMPISVAASRDCETARMALPNPGVLQEQVKAQRDDHRREEGDHARDAETQPQAEEHRRFVRNMDRLRLRRDQKNWTRPMISVETPSSRMIWFSGWAIQDALHQAPLDQRAQAEDQQCARSARPGKDRSRPA